MKYLIKVTVEVSTGKTMGEAVAALQATIETDRNTSVLSVDRAERVSSRV